MLATIFAEVLHVSFRGSASQDKQAGTHTSIGVSCAQELVNTDPTVVRLPSSTQAQEQTDTCQSPTDFCPPHSRRGSLFRLVCPRRTAGCSQRVGLSNGFRALVGCLLCVFFASFRPHLMSRPTVSNNRETDSGLGQALAAYVNVMCYDVWALCDTQDPACQSATRDAVLACARVSPSGWQLLHRGHFYYL